MPGATMNITESTQGQVRIVSVQGRVDQNTADAFATALEPALAACSAGGSRVLLDFTGVDYISSVGLRVLMLAAKQVRSQQGRIAIAALSPVVGEVFEISRFNLIIPVHPSVEAGVAALLQ
jgi:anti-anti-sigma factor